MGTYRMTVWGPPEPLTPGELLAEELAGQGASGLSRGKEKRVG